jgi:hypothetical protein
MKTLFLCVLLSLSLIQTNAQNIGFVKESWADKPVLHTMDPARNAESSVIILDKRRVEYIDNEKNELVTYRTLHRIIRVNDDKGIESFNKVYLGVTDNADIVELRARTILPDGKLIEIDKSGVRDQKDENGNPYKIFAFEGLVKGSEIEYYYTYIRSSSFFGNETLQSSVPVINARVEIVCPERLVFETKAVNGKLKKTDTVLNGKRMITLEQTDIPGVDEEKYSYYNANLQKLEYKLSFNNSRSKTERLFTWNELAKRVHNAYSSFSEKEMKRINEFAKKNGWDKLPDERSKIVAVENYLKKNVATRRDIGSADASDFEKILKNKIASYDGIFRLYAALYQSLNVGYQFVLAADRTENLLDKSFENWNNSENTILYFPGQKKFLAPTLAELRFPWINPTWGAANALFCKTTTIGTLTTAIGELKPVTLEDYTHNASNIEAVLKFNSGKDTLLIDLKQIHSGYSSTYFRASFNFSSAEEQRVFIKEIVKSNANSESILSSKIENLEFENYNDNKPFVLNASVKSSDLLEQAGNKLLVKIGEIIGEQVEMYQEKPRQFPMEIAFPHVLERKIELAIPEGYTVKNLDQLNINTVFKENGETTVGFVSSYKQEGNTLKIHILEEYRKTLYPVSEYQNFKNVINAAADFNKIVLVLEKG